MGYGFTNDIVNYNDGLNDYKIVAEKTRYFFADFLETLPHSTIEYIIKIYVYLFIFLII